MTGHEGSKAEASANVDTVPPTVRVEIDAQGNIIVIFDPDVDPSTVTEDDIVITDKDGHPLKDKDGNPVTVPPLTSTDGGITWTGKIPPNVDGEVKVEVPATDANGDPTYTDKVGNPGTANDATTPVDTVPPTVTVQIHPETVKTVIISGIDPATILNSSDITTEGEIVTGSLKQNADGTWSVQIKTEVEDDDLTFSINNEPNATANLDRSSIMTDSSTTTSKVTFTFSEEIKAGSFSEADLKITGGTLVPGSLKQNADGTWTAEIKVTLGQEVKVEVKDGSYEDLAGNVGADGSDTLETIRITSIKPTADAVGTEITVKGSQQPNDILVDGVSIQDEGAWKDNGDGTWTFTTNEPIDGDKVTATTTDQDGKPISDTASLPFGSIDTIAGDDVINKAELDG